MPAFITNDEFIQLHDTRLIAQIMNDTGNPVSNLSTDPNLTFILEIASGLVLSACSVGGRYSEDDLTNLTGNGQAMLKGLVADLAIGRCIDRRSDLEIDPPACVEQAYKTLDQLSKGVIIFPLQPVIDAGHMQSPAIGIQTIANNNYLRDNIRFFPTRLYTTDQL